MCASTSAKVINFHCVRRVCTQCHCWVLSSSTAHHKRLLHTLRDEYALIHPISVPSGCHDKYQAGKMGQLINNKLIFHSSRCWEGQDQGTRMVAFCWKPSFWFPPSTSQSGHCIPTGWTGPGSSGGGSLLRSLIPFLRAPPSRLRHLPKAPLLNSSRQALGLQHMNWVGGREGMGAKNIQTIIPLTQL